MPTLSGLGGLASGIDTDAIVQKLMDVERQPEARLKLDQQRAQARQAVLGDIATRLLALRDAAADLRLPTTWHTTQTASSSDPTTVAVARTAGASPGSHTITVAGLASAEQRTLTFASPATATELTIASASPGTQPVTIDVAAQASAQEVADAINGRSDAPAYAVVVSGQLVLSSRTAGAARGFTVTSVDSTFSEVAAAHRAGADARYTLDGGAEQTSPTNVVPGAIAGLTLTLVAPTPPGGSVSVTVGDPELDTDAVKAKVKAFVDVYNDTTAFIRDKLAEHRDPKATSGDGALKGLVEGDGALENLLSSLRVTVADRVEGVANPQRDALADLGISTGAPSGAGAPSPDAVAGKLVIDDAALTAALGGDPVGVRTLLGAVTNTSGFAQKLEGVLKPMVGAGGLLDLRAEQAGGEAKALGVDVDDMDKRLALKETRLRAQFLAMEQAMQASQSQSQWLAQQLR